MIISELTFAVDDKRSSNRKRIDIEHTGNDKGKRKANHLWLFFGLDLDWQQKISSWTWLIMASQFFACANCERSRHSQLNRFNKIKALEFSQNRLYFCSTNPPPHPPHPQTLPMNSSYAPPVSILTSLLKSLTVYLQPVSTIFLTSSTRTLHRTPLEWAHL